MTDIAFLHYLQCNDPPLKIFFKVYTKINGQNSHHFSWFNPSVGDNAPDSDRRQKIYGHCYCLLVFT